jgi:hypothetical protein
MGSRLFMGSRLLLIPGLCRDSTRGRAFPDVLPRPHNDFFDPQHMGPAAATAARRVGRRRRYRFALPVAGSTVAPPSQSAGSAYRRISLATRLRSPLVGMAVSPPSLAGALEAHRPPL